MLKGDYLLHLLGFVSETVLPQIAGHGYLPTTLEVS